MFWSLDSVIAVECRMKSVREELKGFITGSLSDIGETFNKIFPAFDLTSSVKYLVCCVLNEALRRQ